MKKSVIAWIILVLAWHGLALLVNNTILIPYPLDVFLKMQQQAQSLDFWYQIAFTFMRIVGAFLLALFLSSVCLIIMHLNQLFYQIISNILTILRVVPTAAIILMALVWLTTNQSVILITLLVMIPLMVDILNQQFRQLKKEYRDPLVLYGSTPFENIIKVLVPLSLEPFLTLCKAAFLLGLKVVISSEVLVSVQNGIGRQLQYARFDLDMVRLFAITLWVILLAQIISQLFDFIIRKSRY